MMTYWFEPGTVVFKCPFCEHPHQGRDMRGMPFDAGRCQGCGQMLVVEQMLIEPVAGHVNLQVQADEDLAPGHVSPQARRAFITACIALGMLVLLIILALLLSSW